MQDRPEESIALLDGNSPIRDHESDKVVSRGHARGHIVHLRHITIVLSIFVLVDLALYLYIFRTIMSEPVVKEFEYRNSYVGLDRLYRSGTVNASRHDPIINVPRIAAQVSSVQPSAVSPEDEHRWLSSYGTMSPLDRRLQVSSEIHTILQFRIMDYGMERCALALRLPAPEDNQDWTLGDDDGNAHLEVCALNVSQPLNPRALSWANRPRCRDHVGTLVAGSDGEARFPDFPCSWGSLHTYEISCASDAPDCALDVWANRNGTWGVFMYQFQTI